jgi:hypothetical protein
MRQRHDGDTTATPGVGLLAYLLLLLAPAACMLLLRWLLPPALPATLL